jgi:hypothetical protein
MKKNIALLIVFFSYLLLSCEEENEIIPSVQTKEVVATSASTVLAKGHVVEIGDTPVLEYGFCYSIDEQSAHNAKKVSLGKVFVKGPFQKEMSVEDQGGYQNNVFFIRAYITNEKGTVYGEPKPINFPSLGITSVVPMEGKVADIITINGTNFSTNVQDNKVTFNDVPAQIEQATNTRLVVKVPSGIPSNYYSYGIRIVVKTGNKSITATDKFKALPSAEGFSPQSGSAGTSITISGSNFSWYSVGIKVGNITTYSSNISSSAITFTLPTGIKTTKAAITIIASGSEIIVPGEFTILPPEITSVSPLSGIGGTAITITGKNFESYNTKILMGNVEAYVTGSTTTSITAIVPKSIGKGKYKVSAVTSLHTVNASDEFTLTSPQITDFQPRSGLPNTYVTITGSNFGSSSYENTVLFGSTAVNIYSWSENSIKVMLPYYMSPGSIAVTVKAGGQSVVTTDLYTVNK